MREKILLTSADSDRCGLGGILDSVGHEILHAGEILAAGECLRQSPALVLLDAELLARASGDLRGAFEAQLLAADIPCLRFTSKGMEQGRMQELTPRAWATIVNPDDRDHVLEQVGLLLRMRQLFQARMLAEEQLLMRQIESEQSLASASHIQRSLLPRSLPQSDAFSFAWEFLPCETVGGDLFYLAPLSEDALMVYLIDVSGHGIPSAMVTVSVYQSLTAQTGRLVKRILDRPPYFEVSGPAEVLTALDKEYPFERFEKFFSIVYLLLDPCTGRVRYCNGGHPAPILVRADGSWELLGEGGTLVGLGGVLPYREGQVQLAPADRLYLYSDGVTEHFSPDGEPYGDGRLLDFLLRHCHLPLEQVIHGLMSDLQGYGRGRLPGDDVSFFGIEFNGPR